MNGKAPWALVAARYALLLAACVSALIYFEWRTGVLNPAFPVYSWIVLAAELVGFLRTLMFLLSAVRVTNNEFPPAPAGATVDVFIPTVNEPPHVVRRTVLAALAIRYPHETWLLDDGQRPEMRDLAAELGCRYVARTEHAGRKAGNLNHALSLARGEFVAMFDADHVADPHFLDRTLGYFSDARLAFVQTPQEFFNVDSFEHLRPKRRQSNGASFFHRVIQRSRDASNSTMFTGSSAVLRRSALDGISGFATGTISEDIQTSLRLHAAGWHSLFHPEILSAGMAPYDGAAYYGQRLRWAQDSLQLLVRENILFRRGLTSGQRLAYLIHVASNFEGWRHIFVYALPIVILVSGILPVQTDAVAFLIHFVPYLFFTTLAFSELARGHGRLDESAVYNLARAPVALIATFTAHRERLFVVTPKTRGPQRVWARNTFAYVLLTLTIGAIAWACGEVISGRSPFPAPTLAILITWALYHVVTAVRLLLLDRRCALDRRATTRFDDTLKASVVRASDPPSRIDVDVIDMSADGFTLRGHDGTPVAGDYKGTIDIAGSQFPFEISVRDAGRGGAVRWSDAAKRAAFDLLLHQRAIERFSSGDRGDRGGLLHTG